MRLNKYPGFVAAGPFRQAPHGNLYVRCRKVRRLREKSDYRLLKTGFFFSTNEFTASFQSSVLVRLLEISVVY